MVTILQSVQKEMHDHPMNSIEEEKIDSLLSTKYHEDKIKGSLLTIKCNKEIKDGTLTTKYNEEENKDSLLISKCNEEAEINEENDDNALLQSAQMETHATSTISIGEESEDSLLTTNFKENRDSLLGIACSEEEEDTTTCTESVKSGQKRSIEENDDDARQALKKVRIFNDSAKDKSFQDPTSRKVEINDIPVELNAINKCLQDEKSKSQDEKIYKIDQDPKLVYPQIDNDQIERLKSKELERLCPKSKQDNLRRICRKDLENMVVQLFADKLLYEHELGRQRDLCKRLEATLEGNRKKAAQFHKEIDDLHKVTQRLQAEYSTRKGQIVTPVKVKRSVGIHVTPNIISKGVTSSESVANSVKYISPTKSKKTEKIQKVEPKCKASIPTTKEVYIQPSAMPKTESTTSIVNSIKTVVVNAAQATATTNGVTSQAIAKAGFIDLTDDEEVSKSLLKSTLTGGTNMVAIPRQAINLANSGQFVAVPQSSMNSVLLVPPSAATLVVTSMANNLQNVNGVSTPIINQPIGLNVAAGSNSPRVILASPIGGGNQPVLATRVPQPLLHPAALPKAPPQQTAGYKKKLPLQPILNLSHKDNTGIVLLWKMAKNDEHETISSYQLYAYQEGSAPPLSSLWKKVGSVKALELPMACTLTQFMSGHTYHFAVRAVDIRNRLGPFSDPKSIRLKK